MPKNQNIFQRLTKLFRSGPIVKRKVRSFRQPRASTAVELFRRVQSDVYSSTLSAYGAFDRMSRYADFSEMESTPEIASGLDIYAEETVSPDDKGRVLHIYSDNQRLRELLENLFYDVLNVEFNLVMWVRNLCKYGDFFLFNDVSPDYGVINVFPISISEIEREEGFDPTNPGAVRFRWLTQGNTTLENWQVTHMRLLGNDAFLPYGTSVLESARRIYRQLILMEDAMLVYRIIRAPERRVFYIDVGSVPPENVSQYIEQAQTSLKRNQVIDKSSGKVDLRYNPMSVDEDYFIPVRGGESGTKVDTLAGGQNTAAIEDVEYIQKKLFAALKIPRAYLGYDEDIGSKATLAQEDIRFSRTISRIQKTVISELNKLAMIHLFCHGFEGDELIDFELALSNPSSMAQQQKLELIRTRFEIAGTAPEGMVDRRWIRKNVLGLSNDEIEEIEAGQEKDKIRDTELETVATAAAETGGDDTGDEDAGGGDLFAADYKDGETLLIATPADADGDDIDEDESADEIITLSIDDEEAPVKAQQGIKNIFNEPLIKRRKSKTKASTASMPNFSSIVGSGKTTRPQDTLNMPYGSELRGSLFKGNVKLEINDSRRLTKDMEFMLGHMATAIGINDTKLLSEDVELELLDEGVVLDGEDT